MRNLDSIIERLKSKVSKADILALANEININQIDFKPLFALLQHNNPLAMRAAWLIENLVIPNSKLQSQYFNSLAKVYLTTNSSSVKRNIGKTIAACSIPKKWEDELYDYCTKMLVDSNEVVAAKFHAMNISSQIAMRYPDLIPELKETIQGQFEKNTVAFSAGAKHAFKLFKKAGY
ncbi:MAG: hypothetical protein ACPGLV_02440 [Bacteroidia bacterium]